MNESEKINTERQELNLLINKGVSIEVDRTIYVKPKGLFGLLKKRVKQTDKQKFIIQEPTLSVLDLISSEQIELNIDEKEMNSDNALSLAKKLTNEHSRRMARIIAISVLGQDYIIPIQKGSFIQYKYDDARLKELTNLFFHNIKPSRMMQYVILINTMSNLGDFTNSIRLMSASRTTMPILIEESKKD